MNKQNENPESGQVLVIVASALFFVLLGAAAVSIDLGNAMLNRQRLQNAADSAALAAAYRIAGGGTHADAVAVAQSLVSQNTNGAISSLPDLGTGSSTGITHGIQTQGGEVRVAITRSDIKTFFAGVLGIGNMTIGAKARAGLNAGGGLLPIAVKRFSEGNTLYQVGQGGNPGPGIIVDQIARAPTTINSWPANWPALITSPASSEPSTASPGPRVAILGGEANANESQGNDFHFWVAPDVRNITYSYPPGPTYDNGVTPTSSIQNLKDIESTYFLPGRMGYSGVKGLPIVGDQIAILNGNNHSATVAQMKKYFDLGKYVIAMIYDGTVHRKPEFTLQASPVLRLESGDPLQDVEYTVTVHQTNATYPYYATGINFSVQGIDSSYATPSFSPTSVNVLGADVSTTLRIEPAHRDDPVAPDTTPKTSGARSFLITANDPLNHIQQTASAAVMFGTSAAFMATCSAAYQQVEQGSSGEFVVTLRGYNGYPNTNVTVGAPSISGPGGVSAGYNTSLSAQSTTELVRDGHNSTFRVYFEASAGAGVGQNVISIPIDDPDPSRNDQVAYLILDVVPDGSSGQVASVSSFVYVLGYVPFQIVNWNGTTNHADDVSSHDNNTVWGKAVGPLVSDPSQLTVGSTVRLIGWSQ